MPSSEKKTGSSKASAYFCVCLTAIIWGSIYIFNRISVQTITSYELAFFRFFFSVIVLFIFIKIKKLPLRIAREDWKHIVVIGLLSYFFNIEFTLLGVTYAGGTMSALLISLTPVVIVVFAAIILKEKLTVKKVICLLVALVGVVIVSSGDTAGAQLIGIICCLGAVICFGLGSVYMRRIAQKYNSTVIGFWAMVVSLPLFTVVGAYSYATTGPFEITPTLVGCVLYAAIAGTALAQSLWNRALSVLEASTCSLFYPLQPVSSAVLGVLLLHESFSGSFLIGALCIMASIIFCFLPIGKKDVS